MIALLLLGALTCPSIKMIGFDAQLSKEDYIALNRAKFVCAFEYKNSPCLVSFEKSKPHEYHALCGAKR